MDKKLLSKMMAEIAKKGAKKRLSNISPAKRKQIAKKAAKARWGSGK